MTTTPAAPTDAERRIAQEVWNEALCNSDIPGWKRDEVFAQALADQRARYEAVADWCEQQAESRSHFAKVDPSYRNTAIPYEAAAERIRQVGK